MQPVTIYTKPGCPFCSKAKSVFDEKSIDYEEIVASNDPAVKAEMVQRANGKATFPQVFIGAVHVGGSDDLAALERAGKLDAMLAA